MCMCMLCIFKKFLHEPIGYSTKIVTDGVEWGRLNIWMVLLHKLQGFIVIALFWLKMTSILLIRKA